MRHLLRILALPAALLLARSAAQGQSHLYTLEGDFPGDRFGSSVSGAGDVDGDGHDDVLIGSPSEGNNGKGSGAARVISGRTGTELFLFSGDAAGDGFGTSVDGGGDLDQDGVPDVIVGAFGYYERGYVRAFSGADGSALVTVYGNSTGDGFGRSCALAGDLNADGYGDFAVGAPYDDAGGIDAGLAAAFLGPAGALHFTVHGGAMHDYLGFSVSSAGDVQGDGHDDVIVGAPRYDGAAYVRIVSGADGTIVHELLSNSPSLQSFGWHVRHAGDFDADGTPDAIVATYPWEGGWFWDEGNAQVFSGADGSLLRLLDSSYSGLTYEVLATAVGAAGDVDADGYGDVMVAGYDKAYFSYDPPSATYGPGFVRFHAGSDGDLLFELAPSAALETWSSWTSLYGAALDAAGDVDGDGALDIVAGIPGHDAPGLDAGAARIESLAERALTADVHLIHVDAGGSQSFSIDAGPAFAGEIYWLVGSASGTEPGIALGGVLVPLHLDAYTLHAIAHPGAPPLSSSLGLLDASGAATAALVAPAGLDPAFVGLTLHHAFALFDPEGLSASFASNAVPLTLVPAACAVTGASTPDCNANGVRDECEIQSGAAADCNDNGRPDECDIAGGTSGDCNGNGIPDECLGVEVDLDASGVPDDCEPALILHVDDDHPSDPGPGDPTVSNPAEAGTAAAPFDSIQEAIDVSASGDVIELADGVYTGLLNRNVSFGGRSITVRSANGPAACILDCEEAGRAFIFKDDELPFARLEGLTLRNGRVSDHGGAILCVGKAAPSIFGCVIHGNYAGGKGGGICVQAMADAVIARCTISDNFAVQAGGGICFDAANELFNSGDPIVRDCLITANSTNQAGGGLIVIGDGKRTVFVDTCTIAANHTEVVGGGVRVFVGGIVRLANSILWLNVSDTLGHALSIYNGAASVHHCNVEGGEAAVHLGFAASLAWEAGNLDVDPLFVGATSGDYHLGLGSPCVDAGDPAFVAAPGQTDLDGDARVLGPAVDAGADERVP